MPSTDDSSHSKSEPTDPELPHTNGSSRFPPNLSPVHYIIFLKEGVAIVFTNIDTYWKSIPKEDKFTISSAKDFYEPEQRGYISDG